MLLVMLAAPSTTAAARPPGDAANAVSEWNAIAATTLAGDLSKIGPEPFLYMGFVQAAVYNAVVGVKGRYAPYRFPARAPRGTSVQAAAVAAAHQVLVTYTTYAQQALDAAYATSLARIPDGAAKRQGIAFGIRAANNIISLRAHDGRNADILFTRPPRRGVWRPTAPTFLPMYTPWLGFVTPLLVSSPTQFGLPGPPPRLTSARYHRDFAEVKALGSATSTKRTAEQTRTALFFSGNALIQYNEALRDQVNVRHLDSVDAARMFAAIDMSIADAEISVWRGKYHYGFWRPITAIHRADNDRNPATHPDRNWMPLLSVGTPPYPDYPGGYNVVNATVVGGLQKLFHTQRLHVTLISSAVPEIRHYNSGRALIKDVVGARVWLGIHFRFADTASRDLGLQLADWTLDHYFKPIHK